MMRRLASLVVTLAALPVVAFSLPFVAPQPAALPAAAGPPQPGPGALRGTQVAAVAYAAGFRGQALVVAVAIAGAESAWVAAAEGDRYPIRHCECHSHGLWQVRSCPGDDPAVTYDTGGCHPPLDRGTEATLDDPSANAQVAYRLAMSPSGWVNWSTYTDNTYLAWMPQAQAAAAAVAGAG